MRHSLDNVSHESADTADRACAVGEMSAGRPTRIWSATTKRSRIARRNRTRLVMLNTAHGISERERAMQLSVKRSSGGCRRAEPSISYRDVAEARA